MKYIKIAFVIMICLESIALGLNNSKHKNTSTVDPYMVDTHSKLIPQYSVSFLNQLLNITFQKDNVIDEGEDSVGRKNLDRQPIKAKISINNNPPIDLFKDSFLPSVYAQNATITTCKTKKNSIVLVIMMQYTDFSSADLFYAQFVPFVYEIVDNRVTEREDLKKYFYINGGSMETDDGPIYPYVTEKKILTHLIEIGLCQAPKFSLSTIESDLKNKKNLQTYTVDYLKQVLDENGLNILTLESFNNFAYYLQQAGANQESAYLLEKIIEKFPNRTVAYFNLGDAYYGLGDKTKALKAYQTYINQMKKKGWGGKIPKRVLERTSTNLETKK